MFKSSVLRKSLIGSRNIKINKKYSILLIKKASKTFRVPKKAKQFSLNKNTHRTKRKISKEGRQSLKVIIKILKRSSSSFQIQVTLVNG